MIFFFFFFFFFFSIIILAISKGHMNSKTANPSMHPIITSQLVSITYFEVWLLFWQLSESRTVCFGSAQLDQEYHQLA